MMLAEQLQLHWKLWLITVYCLCNLWNMCSIHYSTYEAICNELILLLTHYNLTYTHTYTWTRIKMLNVRKKLQHDIEHFAFFLSLIFSFMLKVRRWNRFSRLIASSISNFFIIANKTNWSWKLIYYRLHIARLPIKRANLNNTIIIHTILVMTKYIDIFYINVLCYN